MEESQPQKVDIEYFLKGTGKKSTECDCSSMIPLNIRMEF